MRAIRGHPANPVPLRRRQVRADRAFALLASLVLGCAGSSDSTSPPCAPNCLSPANFLSAADVQQIIAQTVGEAQARGALATIAVVDRVGNVLAVFRMNPAPVSVTVAGGRGVTGGLEGQTVDSTVAAIAKAITGAYLSSWGNAFSSRTAGQIIQQNFNPGELDAPSGPLYGVQFSQLSCSDVNTNTTAGSVGPKRSPLGLSAEPGGLPLYKNGALVGGVGVVADGGVYGIDLDVFDVDQDADELMAVAGSSGFSAPEDIRGERITANGHAFRFVDSESLASDPASAPAFGTLPGALVVVPGYYVVAAVGTGVAFGTPASGYRPATTPALAALGAFTLVDAANVERFPPTARAGVGALSANEVSSILQEGLKIAQRARAQIRRPLGSSAEVSIVVVDLNGGILGLARTPDAPVFGTDVAVQKARG